MRVARIANWDVHRVPHGHGAVYRQLEKVIFNLLLRVLEAHQNRWGTVRYKPHVFPPVYSTGVYDVAKSKVGQPRGAGPRFTVPADASNSDAGAERIRISHGIPAGLPL